MPHLLAELRRRRVVHTAIWYAGFAAAFVQAADIFLPSFGAPREFVRLLVIAAVFGLPIALVLSWCFDVAPAAGHQATRWQQVSTAVAVMIVSVVAAVAVWRRTPDEPIEPLHATSFTAEPAHIAVLTFDAIGGGSELEEFADNLHARLIDGLNDAAQTTASSSQRMRAVSRPAILPYARAGVALDSLRRLFGVGTVLTGTVEQVADAVRVHVRLIDTMTGDQLATRTAQGSAANEVLLLDAVADSALHLVREALGPIVRERAQRLETRKPEAYRHFVLATQRVSEFDVAFEQDGGAAAQMLMAADSCFAQAARIDPRWIEPPVQRSRLARRYLMLAAATRSQQERAILDRSLAYAQRAFAIAPEDYRAFEVRGDARSLLVQYSLLSGLQLEQAATDAKRDLHTALVDNPTPAFALRALSELSAAQDRYEEAVAYGERAYAADPYLEQMRITVFRLHEYTFALGKDADAARWCAEGRRRFVDHIFDDCRLSLAAWADGYSITPDSAWLLAEAELASYPAPLRPRLQPRLYALLAAILARDHQTDSARVLLANARALDPGIGMLRDAAGVYSLLGERDSAVAMLRAYLAVEPADTLTLRRTPPFRRILGAVPTQRTSIR